jgi:hypothetical protein
MNNLIMSRKRCLVVVSGPTAGTDRMYESYEAHIADSSTFDVICTTDNPTSRDKWVRGSRYIVYVPSDLSDRKYIHDYLSDYNLYNDVIADFDERFSTVFGGISGTRGYGFYGLALVRRHFIFKYILDSIDTSLYDRMIILRPDMFFVRKVDFDAVGSNDIVVPIGEDYGGLNDRFVICSIETGMQLLSQLSFLTDAEFRAKLLSVLNVNPERYLYEAVKHCTSNRVVRIAPVGFLLRSIENHRNTWSTGMYSKRLRGFIKSPFEFERAMYVANHGRRNRFAMNTPFWFRLAVWFPSSFRQYSWIIRTSLVSYISTTRLRSTKGFLLLTSLLRVSNLVEIDDPSVSGGGTVWKDW